MSATPMSKLVNPTDTTGQALTVSDVTAGDTIRLENPVNGTRVLTIVLVSSPYCDEDNDGLVTVQARDRRGHEFTITTGELGLTSNRYGTWCNVAYAANS